MSIVLLSGVSPVFLLPAGVVIGLIVVIAITAIRRARNKR